MKTPDEGYVKYSVRHESGEPPDAAIVDRLNRWRKELYERRLIGADAAGVGFGNISIRVAGTGRFVISSTASGGIKELRREHYSTVTDWCFSGNRVVSFGILPPSSEAMTHAAVYQANPLIQAVIHVHHAGVWKELLRTHPHTSSGAAYGTPEMAEEVLRLFAESDVLERRIFAMGGHRDGIISFGFELEEAASVLIGAFEQLS